MEDEANWFREQIAALGFNQSSLAREMAALGDPRNVKVILRGISRYATGDYPVPAEMRVILRLLGDRQSLAPRRSTEARHYLAILERASNGFGVSFPDFPGCISKGATTVDAARMAEQALALHLCGMLEDGEAIPEPTPLERVERDLEVKEFARILVRAELPSRAIGLNISMEEDLVTAVDTAAQKQGKSRSAFLADAARAALHSPRVT